MRPLGFLTGKRGRRGRLPPAAQVKAAEALFAPRQQQITPEERPGTAREAPGTKRDGTAPPAVQTLAATSVGAQPAAQRPSALPGSLAGGVCRGCGCTDDRACPGGCWWVETDLCSSCKGAA